MKQEHSHELSDNRCCDEKTNHNNNRTWSCIEHCIGDYDNIIGQTNKVTSKEIDDKEQQHIANQFEPFINKWDTSTDQHKLRWPPQNISFSPYKKFIGTTILLI